jgi:acyl carrier protein
MADDLRQQILDFIREEYFDDTAQPLDVHTRLISTGIVDSFSMASLKAFLEDQYGIDIPDSRATPTAFDTVEDIAALVEELQGS